MTDSTYQREQPRADATGGLLYRLVWKWHFLASLYVLPFMLMLSLTGGIYLYKHQIEAWLYADAFNVTQLNPCLMRIKSPLLKLRLVSPVCAV